VVSIRLSRSRLGLAVVALGLPLLLAAAAHPSAARSAGLDVWNFPRLEREFDAATEQSRHLTDADADIQQRIAYKDVLITELIEGRATLPEVTSQFLVLNESHPEYMAVIRADYPGRTDQEKAARNVIGHVRARVTNPVERARGLGRLQAELEQMTDPGATAR